MNRQPADGDVREVLTAAARGWVERVTRDEALALRALIAAEPHRFPQLGRAWSAQDPARFAEPLADHERLESPAAGIHVNEITRPASEGRTERLRAAAATTIAMAAAYRKGAAAIPHRDRARRRKASCDAGQRRRAGSLK